MKTEIGNLRMLVVTIGAVFVAFVGSLQAQPMPSVDGKSGDATRADALWQSIEAEQVRPVAPKEWQSAPPSQEAIRTWSEKEAARLIALANRARDFGVQFPQDARAGASRLKERQAVEIVMQYSGDAALEKRLDALDAALLKDPAVGAPARFEIRLGQIQHNARSGEEAEQMARGLVKDFPDNPASFFVLLQTAKAQGSDRLRLVAGEIVNGSAPEEVKVEARRLLSLTELIGKPLSLQFTALDGQPVDLQKLHGKVVLIDFWATWCMPCVGEIPNVKAAYAKLHDKGFEILGINFDRDKGALLQFLKAKEMPWPQSFDGLGMEGRFAKEFGIEVIPTMWLVDKKGVLRDQDAREGLADKVEKLLAEP